MEHDKVDSGAAPGPAYADLAGLMDLALLQPELPESRVAEQCEEAKQYGIAAVTVRPSDVDLAVHWMKGSPVVLGTVVDWPHGHSSTSVKTYAVRDMLRRGAREIETVMNTGKLVSRQFQYIEMELAQMAAACHSSSATLKVSLEDPFLDEELRIVACRIAKRAGVDFLGTSQLEAVGILREHARERFKLYATGIHTLEQALQFREAGCQSLTSGNATAILDQWTVKLASETAPASVVF